MSGIPPSWSDFEDGATLGSRGTESGIIVLDEEYDEAARISLERETGTAPFAITCGVYGRLMHTRFFDLEAEARSEYAAMKVALQEIVDGFDSPDPQANDRARQILYGFLDRFPT
jgi:hypothetical protein